MSNRAIFGLFWPKGISTDNKVRLSAEAEKITHPNQPRPNAEQPVPYPGPALTTPQPLKIVNHLNADSHICLMIAAGTLDANRAGTCC